MKSKFTDSDLRQIISDMTIKEKAAQMTQLIASLISLNAEGDVTGPAAQLNLTKEDVYAVGSVLNFRGADMVVNMQEEHIKNDRHHIPLLPMMDVIHGCRTIYPIPLALGGTFEPELIEKLCAMAARESTACGCKVTFAPMVDLARDARWGRVMETTGEDPYMNCLYAKSAVKGFQGDDLSDPDRIAACLKHFAAYGAAEAGRDYNTVDMSERTAREYYLPAYKAAVDAGIAMAMTSFNIYDGIPLSANKKLAKDMLRDEWGFDGVVISDYNAFGEMVTHGYENSGEEITRRALESGVDIEMMSLNYLNNIEKCIESGKISLKEVDECMFRILKLKRDCGVMDDPTGYIADKDEEKDCLTKQNRELVRIAAEKSAVLLKNDGILPLKDKKIALIGPFGDTGEILGMWRCYGRAQDTVTVKTGFENAGVQCEYAKGCSYGMFDEDESGFAEAIEAAKKADTVVMCVGEWQDYSGEGKSRGKIDIPPLQVRLINEIKNVNDNIVLVVFAGRPLVMTDIMPLGKAVVWAWQPGTEGGNALAELLTGKANFEGKLAMTFPYHVAQCPIYYNHMSTGRPKPRDDYRGGKYYNDRAFISMYVDIPNAPLFPYGYGLSYSKFETGAVTLSSDTMEKGGCVYAEVTVKNVSEADGAEVVQLYIHDKLATRVRPVKELKDYKKVYLAAGQITTVRFEITEDKLKFWDENMNFAAEPGEFEVYIGFDSDTDNKARFTLL